MLYPKSNQKGFAALEAILIIIIVAIIGGTGYYMYKANKNANKTYNIASSTSSVKSKTQSNGGKGGIGDSNAQTGPAKTEVFLIPEWKVSAAIPTPPKQAALIQYQIMSSGAQASAAFTTQELIDAGGSDCSVGHEPAGLIIRAKGSDTFYLDDGTSSGNTVSQELASGSRKPYKRAGDYYYWYVHSQTACGDPTKTGPLQMAATAQVKQIVTHLQQD